MEAPPTTFVPADDRIFAPEAQSAMWLALGVGALVVGVALTAVALRPLWRRDQTGGRSALALSKERHLAMLDALAADLAAGRVGARAAHHELSRTLRRFAEDVGASGAPAMSVAALRHAGAAPVATAIHGYEIPQFHPAPDADPVVAVDQARSVIASWTTEGPA